MGGRKGGRWGSENKPLFALVNCVYSVVQPAHFSVFSLLWVVRYGLASLTILC